MRVLQLNTHSSGGSYEYAALLSAALAGQGIESQVLCKGSQRLRPGRHFLDRVIRKAYVSLSTKPWHGTQRLIPPPRPEKLQGFDLVHLHTVADWFNVPGWLETLPTGMGVVITLHDLWHFTGGCFLYDGCDRFTETCAPCPILKTPLNRILAKGEQRRKLRAYRDRCVQFVANSQWLADLAGRSPIVGACGGARVIMPGIDTDIFKRQNKAECRAKLGIPMESFVVAAGAASLTDKNKNVPWLLEQVSRLPNLKNVRLVLAGNGEVPVSNPLDVHFMGNLTDGRERACVFGAADIFISASLMETYGLTLIEAMSCGTPVVAFRTGGVPEAVSDGEGGIVCELLGETEFKAAVEKLRSCPGLRNQLGSAASNLVATRNSKTRFAAAFARLYEECLNVGGTPPQARGSRGSSSGAEINRKK
jgi:glycosyltransferase involved in cell wall biosynthesis